MEALLILLPNASSSLPWVWLGHHIVINKPFVIRVLCVELCAIDALLYIFAMGDIPWTTHNGHDSLPPAFARDLVLIFSETPEETESGILVAAKAVNAFRARYLLVQNNFVDDQIVLSLARFAWKSVLHFLSIVRIEGRTIFETLPSCHQPRVKEVSFITWHNLKMLDLSNCTLRIQAIDLAPLIAFKGKDENSFHGAWLPFFQVAKSKLHFKTELVPLHIYNISASLIKGTTDMAIFQFALRPNMSIDVAGKFVTSIAWCIPDSCVRRYTSPVLWEEFSALMWTFLVASILMVSLAVQQLAPPPGLTLQETIFQVIATLTANVVRLPRGLARWPMVGWLLSTVVLGTCYQTVLHSLMAAPSSVHEVRNLDELSKSTLRLAFSCASSCPGMFALAREDQAIKHMLGRVYTISTNEVLKTLVTPQKRVAILTSLYTCHKFFTGMTSLRGYRLSNTIFGMYGVAKGSWLAPAFHHISSQLESSGLASIWLKFDAERPSCSDLKGVEPDPITTAQLWPAFVLMVFGSSLAGVALIAELLWFWRGFLRRKVFSGIQNVPLKWRARRRRDRSEVLPTD